MVSPSADDQHTHTANTPRLMYISVLLSIVLLFLPIAIPVAVKRMVNQHQNDIPTAKSCNFPRCDKTKQSREKTPAQGWCVAESMCRIVLPATTWWQRGRVVCMYVCVCVFVCKKSARYNRERLGFCQCEAAL